MTGGGQGSREDSVCVLVSYRCVKNYPKTQQLNTTIMRCHSPICRGTAVQLI